MAEAETKRRALFVCLGNSCRSPIAEGVFQKTVNKMAQGHLWEVDSAGLADWNVGCSPTDRAKNTLRRHDVPYHNVGRQITEEDFNSFDFIFGMDETNIRDLREMAPEGCRAKIFLFGEFDPEGERIIRDPYFVAFDGSRSICHPCWHRIDHSLRPDPEPPAALIHQAGGAAITVPDFTRAANTSRRCMMENCGNMQLRQMPNSIKDNHDRGFEKCYQQVVRCSKGFLEWLEKR